MTSEGNDGAGDGGTGLRSWWTRLSVWLGLDRSEPVDLLRVDPALHFREWDRDLPNRYWG
jgi:hypothetical protein